MQLQSIDVRYDSNPNIMYYNLSCSLLNVYKGRCDLFLVNSNTDLKQELSPQWSDFNEKIYDISSLTKEGVDELIHSLVEVLNSN